MSNTNTTNSSELDLILKQELAKVIADLHSPKDIQAFLTVFLSENELTMIAKRLAIFKRLSQNISYETIQQELSVSSATVSTIAQLKSNKFAQKVATVLNAQDWAEQTASRLRQFLSKKEPQPTT